MHKFSRVFLCILVVSLTHTIQTKTVEIPELFDKDQRADRLIIKNQIGYHSKKIVREVTQELFVSRKIDVSPLYMGIEVLQLARNGVASFCNHLLIADYEPVSKAINELDYMVIERPVRASFAEAKARCEAQGLQLPEIYNEEQRRRFVHHMEAFNISHCFAGLQSDTAASIHRFIATGFPIWRGLHHKVYTKDNQSMDITNAMDDVNARFLYSKSGQLVVSWNHPTIIHDQKLGFGSHGYWEAHNEFSQVLSRTVCEPKWKGHDYRDETETMQPRIPGVIIKNRFMREATLSRKREFGPHNNQTMDEFLKIKGLKNYCRSVANQADEIQKDMSLKLKDLFSLVDIKVQYEDIQKVHGRVERAAFLAQFIFSTGVRLIWGLVGFLDKLRMNRKIKNIEYNLSKVQEQVGNHSQQIADISKIIYGHSIAIQQLTIATADLGERLSKVESRVYALERSLDNLADKVESMISLSLISNLINRIQQSLNTGYDTLKDIVHSSLLDQTSPLLLPAEQMKKVHQEANLFDGVLDTDFAKMQSIIVSDPNDPHLLLVVINIAALSRKNSELVNLIPVPFYEGTDTFVPVLDYHTVLLDQKSGIFSILNEQEQYDCLFGRCYSSDVEHSIHEKSCGIPQMTSQSTEGCMTERILSNGVYIKPMLPDGIIFAFQREVTTQLFCDEGKFIGPNKQLTGTGTMQLPNGCVLSVRDQGRTTNVKSQPIYHLVNGGELKLMPHGPLSTSYNKNSTNKVMTRQGLMSEHMSLVIQQLENVDEKISNQATYIWSLVGMILVVTTCLFIVVTLSYRFSGRFRMKIYDLRDSFEHVFRRLSEVETKQDESKQGRPPPVAPRPPVDVVLNRLPVPFPPNRVFSPTVSRNSSTYLNLNEFRPNSENSEVCRSFQFTPMNHKQRDKFCPNAPPFSDDRLGDQLLSEQREMENLCNQSGFKGQTVKSE